MRKILFHGCPFGKRLIDILFGVVIGVLLGADILFARQIDMSKAGVSLWIFVAVGAFIILLQLIPAFILFTSFIGTSMHGVHKSVKVEDKAAEPCCEESK